MHKICSTPLLLPVDFSTSCLQSEVKMCESPYAIATHSGGFPILSNPEVPIICARYILVIEYKL